MSVLETERTAVLQDEVGEFARVLGRFRWRLGFERLLVSGLRGLMASALAFVGLSLAAWLMAGAEDVLSRRASLAAIPALLALALTVLRWPSPRQAALAADQRLDLAERLGTAVELAGRARRRGRSERFDRLQIQDAIEHARLASGGWLTLDRRLRRDALGAAALALLAAGSLLLPSLPRPGSPTQDQTPSADAGAQVDAAQRALPFDAPVPAAEPAPPVQAPARPASADLAALVQQGQSERAALDALSQALGQVSATQPAADAMRRGDFSTAKQQIAGLGDEADQLSAAAKQQLGRALQRAASTTTTSDPQLAARERQAAQALAGNTYVDQRQALHNLADQIERSGAHGVPADQLARAAGQLQQQAVSQAPGAPGAGQSGDGQAQSAGASDGRAAGPAQQSASGSAAPQADSGGDTSGTDGAAGQQLGAGIGSGSGGDPLGGPPSRLDSAGQSVSVPLRLGNGSGVRPPDGTEDQTSSNPSAGPRSVSEQAQTQQTGQVTPETNLVPSEQRPVVRGYFQ